MEEFTSRRKRLVLAALCATMFMAMLDNVIVNNALPRIGQQLHAGVSGLQWVVEGYAWSTPPSCSPAAHSATGTAADGSSSPD
ncbi:MULTISPECIES: hypothetical protein [unclassified Streptomyces]|uniref:MFS transporter n=1 Tax=unclassified Streptomyces TaxID=2593676 RepID=UPI0033E1619F